MNWNKFISNRNPDKNINRCPHGLPSPTNCDFCNGNADKKRESQLQRKEYKERQALKKKRTKLQALSILTATKHKEPITEEDITYFIKESAGTDKIKDIKILFTIAVCLKRRLGAIEWWWNFTWAIDKYLNSVTSKKVETLKLIKRLQDIKLQLGY